MGLPELDKETPATTFLWSWSEGPVLRRMVISAVVVSEAYKQLQPWQPRREEQRCSGRLKLKAFQGSLKHPPTVHFKQSKEHGQKRRSLLSSWALELSGSIVVLQGFLQSLYYCTRVHVSKDCLLSTSHFSSYLLQVLGTKNVMSGLDTNPACCY